ncbi:NTF2-like N-terminal transpeptidase domain-containing protein [uncultured Chryseobacterium sp.]|uniref:NTF2-like N-terminal transpeptidase domain-containing protein n=1 Tax=uncultured Chryseobacterium sp. TaxID=259322 RepID=UPI00261F9BE3|nr:NTF2-like N-terminal transpeptidase domain-containing protein [uncultured Chryseobacterium sp.]
MKRFSLLLLLATLLFVGCKKDKVDATDTKSFQSSINDMASSLSTLQQVKFNEALYVLKTFGVEGDDDVSELHNLGKLLNGKKVPEIMALADQVAQKNGIAWTSKGPPSLGEMNIFGNEKASEFDANDIKASSLSLITNEVMKDSILGVKGIQVVPRLVDGTGKPIDFSGAALEAVMEVYSGGNRLLTSKNLMQDNDFKGFTVRFASLPMQKIRDNKIDVTVSVKSTKKTYKMSKIGIAVNPKALLSPQGNPAENPANPNTDIPVTNPTDVATGTEIQPAAPTGDPKTSVTRFLNNLGSQNLREAYDTSDNPNWGSYETFSNPTSGFGGVKNINVKNITTQSSSTNSASVNATYDVTDKSGKTTALQVTFGLKNVNGEWKISSYRIN